MNVDVIKSKFADWFYLNALEKLYFVKTQIKKEDISKRLDDYLKIKLHYYGESC
jgi:hypothetical protein